MTKDSKNVVSEETIHSALEKQRILTGVSEKKDEEDEKSNAGAKNKDAQGADKSFNPHFPKELNSNSMSMRIEEELASGKNRTESLDDELVIELNKNLTVIRDLIVVLKSP